MRREPRKAVILISNDLSHPALHDQQYDFSWRINRLRPLLKRGYLLVVVTAGGRVGRGGRATLASLRPRITNDGNLVVISPPIVRLPMLWLLQSMILTPLTVSLYCRSHGLSVEGIVGASVPYGAIGKFLNRLLGTALVVDYGDPDYVRERGMSLRILRFLEAYVLGRKGVDAVTCIDPNIRDHVRRYRKQEAVFLPPGGFWADKTSPQPGTTRKGGLRVIYAGHVAPPPAYRLDLLMDAAPKVLARSPDASVVILGSGEYLGSLRRRAAELGVSDRVELPGGVTYAESLRRIREADVAVQVLNDMCLGTKVVDYFAQGKAVVACGSFYASYREFLASGENCVLVPPDAERLADAISRLLADAGLRERLGANALRAVSRYDWDSQASVILGLMETRPRRP